MSEDEQARRLRERLDRELAAVRSDPSALREVLERGRAEPEHRATPSRWLVAAAAALVVAVAAPVLATTVLDHRGGGSSTGGGERLAGPAAPPSLAATTTPTTPRPTALPTRRPGVTPAPVPPVTSAPPSASTRPTRGATAPVPPPSSSPSSSPTGCAPVPAAAGAAAGPAVSADLDGDGTADTLTVDGGTLVARLSSGGGAAASLRAVSGSLAVLPVETDGSRGTELLLLTRGASADDGTVGQRGTLYDLRSCALVPVTNAQGTPYVFRVGGDATGSALSGVACESGALVGLTSARQADGSWRVTHTPVTSSAAGRATNGRPTVQPLPAGDPQVAALSEVSCGGQLPVPLD